MTPKRRKHHRGQAESAREIPIEDGDAPGEAPSASEDASGETERPGVEAYSMADLDRATEGASDPAPEAPEPEPTPEEQARMRVRELEDRLKRVQAEFLNETKRISRQADERTKYAVEDLVKDLLPVFDAMHSARDGFAGRARAAEEAADEGAADADRAALEGFELIEKELLNVLGRHGVTRIEAVGVAFDPAHHHAIVMVERPDLEAGAVAMELRPGFMLNGRVVRPAHVAVAAAEKES